MTVRAALAFFIAVSAAAQVRESVTVNLIEVPVTVVDSRGNPVRRLTRANFEVFDEGKKQVITSFEMVDFAAPQLTTAISPLNPAARRSFLLLFDLAFSGPNSIGRAQEAARRFVSQSLKPRDLVAVAVIDQDRGCRLLSSFTTDRELIAAAIDNPTTFRSVDPLGISNQTRAFVAELEQPGLRGFDPLTLPQHGHGPEGVKNELDVAKGMERTNEGLIRQRVERHVDALGELAAILNAVPGRKQVLLLSEGVPANILLGRDGHDSKAELEQAERIIRGAWATESARMGDSDTDRRFGSTATQTLLERMARRFSRNDVVLHALDLQGARVQNDTFGGERVNSNGGLAALARSTGGDVFQSSNRLDDDFARLLHQQEVVYVLGFQTAAAAGAFRDLKVKVSGAGRVRVRHRAGYLAGASSPDRSLTDAEIIINDVAQPEIRMATLAAPIPAAGPRAAVPLILDFNGADLLSGVAVADAEAQLFVYAFDESGAVRDRFADRLVLHATAAGDVLRRNNLRYFATLALPPGKYAIKALVRVPQTGRKGFARTDIEVLPPGEIAILPPLSLGWSDAVLVRGVAHAADLAFPFHLNGEPFMPGALVAVRKGVPSRFALFVYNAPADDIRLDAIVTGIDGQMHSFTPPVVARLQGDNVAKIVFDYAATDDNAARLDIVVHISHAAAERRVSIPLEIR